MSAVRPCQFKGFSLTPMFSHFGSDTPGVNTTRRYLCEALSFQYRYVPIGLLEVLPPKINDRAPAFKGRNELGMFELVVRKSSALSHTGHRNAPCEREQPRLGKNI